MTPACDHTSVGVVVFKDEKLLLIERAKFPSGFAIPAGHVDGDLTYEESARRELQEETGLKILELRLVAEGRKENTCRRENGTWHYWKIYEAHVAGKLERSLAETKQAGWYTKEEIVELAKRTEEYRDKKISEEEWGENPGLEPVMREWLTELNIIEQS